MILDPSAPNPHEHTDNEITQFWDLMERTVELPEVIQDEANTALVGYLKRSCNAYMVYINSDRDLCRMAAILIDSAVFKQREEFCISKLLSLLSIDLLELNMKFLISYILLWNSKNNLNSLDTMLNYQGFSVFYNTCYTQFAYLTKYGEGKNEHQNIGSGKESDATEIEMRIIDDMKQISIVLLDLLFQIFKYCKCNVENVQTIDDFFVYYLMVSLRSDTVTDMFNNVKFKLLLALNEQYMMFDREYEIENKIFKYLCNSSTHTSFTELLLLKFNRVQDKSLRIMMCKILHLVLCSKISNLSMTFFYLNDLNVLVDVLIRELQNISENEEVLRNHYLRVLLPLLKNTELSTTHYKKEELKNLLRYLSSLDNISGGESLTEEHHLTTKLAVNVLRQVSWIGEVIEECDSDSTSGKSSITGITPMTTLGGSDRRPGQFYANPEMIYSAESLGKRKAKPPPPPPARKVRMP